MLTETEIISGLKTGKDEAVEAVLNIFGDRLLRAALAITGDLQTNSSRDVTLRFFVNYYIINRYNSI